MPPTRIVASLCLGLSMALVGSYVALSKSLVLVFPVFLLAWLRFGIGALAMLHWLRPRLGEVPLTSQVQRLLFLESFLGNFLFSLFMLYGISLTTAVSAGVVMAAIPAMVGLLSWIFLGERINTQTALALTCAGLGIALLGLGREESSAVPQAGSAGNQWLGNLFIFCAVICEAAYAVIGKKLTQNLTPKRISAIINLWGFVLVTPFGLYTATTFDFQAVSPGIWTLLVFYSLAASVWTVWLWMTGLKNMPAASAGVFAVFLPVSAALVGVLVLGEPVGMIHLAAMVLALLGVLLATLPRTVGGRSA